MRLKYRIEEGVIVLFSVIIMGYASKQVLQFMLDKIWLANRWQGRFYAGIRENGRGFTVEINSFNKKDDLTKSDFIRQVKAHAPKNKLITVS